jgi:hypothetical protein
VLLAILEIAFPAAVAAVNTVGPSPPVDLYGDLAADHERIAADLSDGLVLHS